MPANDLIFKLVMTPLIIAAATLISRRWGERIGGLVIGLPLTSGPVSVFFAIEQGRDFAEGAAFGAILGLVAVAVFCTAYVQASKHFPWYLASTASIGLYLAAVWLVSFLTPRLGWEVILVPAVLAAALLWIGKVETGEKAVATPWWDLPLRMVVATTLLVLITSGASLLGPKWGGLLSPFPVFTFVMATFSHSQGGPSAAWRLIRGVLSGLFSYTAFFVVVGLMVESANLVLVYSLATLTALAVNGLSLAITLRAGRAKAYNPFAKK
jgi:hypothetical protein